MVLHIGIAGPTGAGKTTVALALAEVAHAARYDVVRLPLAAPLKHIARNHFGWDGQRDERGRRLLQVLGTEAGRAYNPEIWLDAWRAAAARAPAVCIADDVRFLNEATYFRRVGVLVHVTGRAAYSGTHASEVGPGCEPGDLYVDNSWPITALPYLAAALWERILATPDRHTNGSDE